MNKTSTLKQVSKSIRYLLVANNLLLIICINYLTDFGRGGNIEKGLAFFVLIFFLLSSWTLHVGSVGMLGNDFWILIAFHLIIAAISFWMTFSYFVENTQSILHIFDDINLKTIGYLYLIPGSLLSLWTAFLFFNNRKIR